MRIYNKKDFIKLPEGTFFAKGVQWTIDGFCVKGESFACDFFYTNLVSIDAFDSRELSDRQDEMLEKGTSYPINSSEGRDGSFCDEDIFLVFEEEDLKVIRAAIDDFLQR